MENEKLIRRGRFMIDLSFMGQIPAIFVLVSRVKIESYSECGGGIIQNAHGKKDIRMEIIGASDMFDPICPDEEPPLYKIMFKGDGGKVEMTAEREDADV